MGLIRCGIWKDYEWESFQKGSLCLVRAEYLWRGKMMGNEDEPLDLFRSSHSSASPRKIAESTTYPIGPQAPTKRNNHPAPLKPGPTDPICHKHTLINGHATGTDLLEVPTPFLLGLYKVYVRPSFQGISPQNMAKNMVLTYLQFRILKISQWTKPLINTGEQWLTDSESI